MFGSTANGSVVSPTTQEFKENPHLFSLPVECLIIALYVVVLFFGICGNAVVCYLFASKRVKCTSFNMLLLNLSVADLLADIFMIPYVFVGPAILRRLSNKNANWICAFTMGKVPFWVVTAVSLLSLSFISMTRYLQVKYPIAHSKVTSRRGTVISIIIMWLVGLALPAPLLLSFKYKPEIATCHRKWPEGFNGKIYSAATAIIGIVLPTAWMIFTFISTARILRKLNSHHVDDNSNTQPLLSTNVVQRRKAVKLLGGLIIVFIICWSPFFIYWCLSGAAPAVFPQGGAEWDYARMRVHRCCLLVAFCNTVADPLIYALRGEEFRKALRDIIQKLFSKVCHRQVLPTEGRTNKAVPDQGNPGRREIKHRKRDSFLCRIF